ncbi:uncharacterized protein LOC111639822 [Centruroides sculpturatus]|uniref:uncharacterized protein LOC111639822 n=1 Tax=Centruroides sculpturatus TaxID=218467 RepID=UPI000C6E2B95|nr:uncharacterized protein LOC111639822 [Centruroides sculpturatus]
MKSFVVFAVVLSTIGFSVEQQCEEIVTPVSTSSHTNIYDERGIGMLIKKQTFQANLGNTFYVRSVTVRYFLGNSSASNVEFLLEGYLTEVKYVDRRGRLSRQQSNEAYTFVLPEVLVDKLELSARTPYQINESNSYLRYEIRGCPIEFRCHDVVQPLSVVRKSYPSELPRCPYMFQVSLPRRFNITEISVTFDLENAPVVVDDVNLYTDFVTSLSLQQGETVSVYDFSKPISVYPRDASTDKFWLQPWPLPDCNENDLTSYMDMKIYGCPYDTICDSVIPAKWKFLRRTEHQFQHCSQFLNLVLDSEFYVTSPFTGYVHCSAMSFSL